jgi:hypothetical protein
MGSQTFFAQPSSSKKTQPISVTKCLWAYGTYYPEPPRAAKYKFHNKRIAKNLFSLIFYYNKNAFLALFQQHILAFGVGGRGRRQGV